MGGMSMTLIGSSVQFSGLWERDPKKRLAKSVKRITTEQKAMEKAAEKTEKARQKRLAQQKKAEEEAKKAEQARLAQQQLDAELAEQAAPIRAALGQILFTDRDGDFQGWHLLKLVQKSTDHTWREFGAFWDHKRKEKQTASLSALNQQFEILGALDKLKTAISDLKRLNLVADHYDGSYLKLTEQGDRVLETFKKDVKKGGPLSGKRGIYTIRK